MRRTSPGRRTPTPPAAGLVLGLALLASSGASVVSGTERSQRSREPWRDRFDVERANLRPTGDNPFIPMQPGRVLVLSHKNDTLTVTVLAEAQQVDGVTAGVLEERETKDGQLAEVSRNFLATDARTGDVYYFGEDVDNYRGGKVVSHESAWRAGVKGARFGLMVPSAPSAGQRFYQELAPKVAMDRVEVVSTEEMVTTPAGTFRHCLHLRETTPLEGDVSHKYFAPGVGLIRDDDFVLAATRGFTRPR
jgi:hypothetical protein